MTRDETTLAGERSWRRRRAQYLSDLDFSEAVCCHCGSDRANSVRSKMDAKRRASVRGMEDSDYELFEFMFLLQQSAHEVAHAKTNDSPLG